MLMFLKNFLVRKRAGMPKSKAKSSQLIIFEDGTLYHIDLRRSDNMPHNVLLVGASDRVDLISSHFDMITFENRNKARPEFHTIVGIYKDLPVAAMSIGIGMGPIDIAVNELHALFEYDHKMDSWTFRKKPRINIIRVGTCGTSLPEVSAGALAISSPGIGLDNLGAYYPIPVRERDPLTIKIEQNFLRTKIGTINPLAYCSPASPTTVWALRKSAEALGEGHNVVRGITTASPGFFGPEGRQIGRLKTAFSSGDFRKIIQSFNVNGLKIINHEMETGILFRLGHEHLSYNVGAICLVIDNLATDEVITGDEAKEKMNVCIKVAL